LCVFRAACGREACLFEFGDEASVVILDFGGGARARSVLALEMGLGRRDRGKKKSRSAGRIIHAVRLPA